MNCAHSMDYLNQRVSGCSSRSNVFIVLKFQQTLLGKQTNPNKSQKKLKIEPTLAYHIPLMS
jgi:hypothetical protein